MNKITYASRAFASAKLAMIFDPTKFFALFF